jgi:hypothetical protein
MTSAILSLPRYWMLGGGSGDDDNGMCYKIGARVKIICYHR